MKKSKRPIFEEKDAPARADVQLSSAQTRTEAQMRARTALKRFMGALLLLLCAIILLGGLTRLTDSGLSITDWAPIMGALPPLSVEEWQAAFARYQQTYEFRYQNSAMEMREFKTIFWWEWAHRQLGRLIGLVWAVGFFILWWRGMVLRGWGRRLFILGALGGFQGAIGWWMVRSGLGGEMTDVAAYRLGIHLGIAFVILGLVFWYYQRLSESEAALLQRRRRRIAREMWRTSTLGGLVFVQILVGALVAGLDAGSGYRDWPLMLGQFFPDGALSQSPLLYNFFENPALVQFNHRTLAYLIVILAVWNLWRARLGPYPAFFRASLLLMLGLFAQMVLGIIALMGGVPLGWGILHQGGGIIVWLLVLKVRFLATYPKDATLGVDA